MQANTSVKSFEIQISDERIRRIKSRLADISWPRLSAPDWRCGPPQSAVRDLADYWAHQYDWKREQQHLNIMPQFRAAIDGGSLHFVHKKLQNRTTPPVVLLHGWPSSFYEFYEVAERIGSGAGDAGAERRVSAGGGGEIGRGTGAVAGSAAAEGGQFRSEASLGARVWSPSQPLGA